MSYISGIRPQAVDDAKENASWYGECAAGAKFYAYVGNDPLNRVDPSGLCFEDACVLEGTGAGAIYLGASALVAAGLCVETCGGITNSINSAAASIFNSAPPTLPPGVGPGPYAGPSVPAGPGPRPTADQQQAINAAGAEAGCHTCGTTDRARSRGTGLAITSRRQRSTHLVTRRSIFLNVRGAATHKAVSCAA